MGVSETCKSCFGWVTYQKDRKHRLILCMIWTGAYWQIPHTWLQSCFFQQRHMTVKLLLKLSPQSWSLGVLDLGRCAQHIQAIWKGWSVGRCEIKCEIQQMPAWRLVGVCYSGIPRHSFCGPASSENILTDPCWWHIDTSWIPAHFIRWCHMLCGPGTQPWF